MKSKVLILLVSMICADAYGLHTKTNEKVSLRMLSAIMKEEGDSLKLSISMSADGIHPDYACHITPVIYDNAGNRAETCCLSFFGKRKRKAASRELALGNRNSCGDMNFYGSGDTVSVVAVIPLPEWTGKNTLLKIEGIMEGCCNSDSLATLYTDTRMIYNETEPLPSPPIIIPQELSPAEKLAAEYNFVKPLGKADDTDCGLMVYFHRDKYDIDPEYRNNMSNIQKFTHAISTLGNDKKLKIAKIVIAGYASIEGTAEYNFRLAGKRANMILKIAKGMNIPEECIEIRNMGEGWDELRKLIEATPDVPAKEEILNIIDTVPVNKGRELNLMKLHRGEPYRWMMEKLFPMQRNAGFINIYYEER